MTSKVLAAALVLLALLVSYWAVRRSLKQRPTYRMYRQRFFALADELVAKPEIPDILAQVLVVGSAIPAGRLTRVMVRHTAFRVFAGRRLGSRPPVGMQFTAAYLSLPQGLKGRYGLAILTLALSDTYRSAFIGPLWRAVNSWVIDAVQDIQPDVNAHATQHVVSQVARAHPPRRSHHDDRELCPA